MAPELTDGFAPPNLADVALGQVGVREVGGNNRGPMVEQYQMATWLEPGAWPWCAAFVCWCIREWASRLPPKDPVFGGRRMATWRPKTAAAFDFERWAKDRGHEVATKDVEVARGALVVFDMSHIGIAAGNAAARSRYLRTVEGNTGPAGRRDSNEGDGVFLKRRPRSLVRSIIHLVQAA